ncbi:MAG: hypothetical protein KA099_09315 [Alphaproteobacteria bacterium]|nr:hypothetical protein [Alphaproteobacteria bacterium]MBP7762301.1 hypothetical protein [Alphaproteobacteria bacterium]MBP7905511.1 hypothetical protein [Alphaproteobacteria bacterium]
MADRPVRCLVTLPGVPGGVRVPVWVSREECFALREGQRVGGNIRREQQRQDRQDQTNQTREDVRRRNEEIREQREIEGAAKRRAGTPEGALDRIERNLDAVLPVHIRVQGDKPSELVDFMQKSLAAMNYSSASGAAPNGIADPDFLRDLNGFIMVKQKEPNFQDLSTISDISQLSGRHVQAIVDSLRDQGIMTGKTPTFLKELAQGLREIDNTDLRNDANKLDPGGARMRTGALLETDNPIVVASAPSSGTVKM